MREYYKVSLWPAGLGRHPGQSGAQSGRGHRAGEPARNREERKVTGMSGDAASKAARRRPGTPVAPSRGFDLKRTLGNENGVIFVIAMLAVAVLFLVVTSVASLASGELRATPYWRDRSGALYVAESGFNHAKWKIDNGRPLTYRTYPNDPPSFTSDEIPGLVASGDYYEVWVLKDGLNFYITVRAKTGSQWDVLQGTVQQPPPFNSGQTPDGDEGAGGGDSDPTITVPPDIDNLTDIKLTSDQTSLTLNLPYYVVNTVSLEGNGTLYIDPAVPVDVLYVYVLGSKLSITGTCVVNPDNIKKLVFIMVPNDTDQSITISGDATVNAFIWSEGATTKITGNATVYGAVVGDFKAGSGSCVWDPAGATLPWPDGTIIDTSVTDYGRR